MGMEILALKVSEKLEMHKVKKRMTKKVTQMAISIRAISTRKTQSIGVK